MAFKATEDVQNVTTKTKNTNKTDKNTSMT